jgi:ABC-2 type transport system permease protein
MLRAELRRVADRRLVRRTVLLVVAAVAIGGILAFAATSSLSEATFQKRVATAQAQDKAQQVRAEACLRAHGVKAGDDFTNDIARQCLPDNRIRAHDPRLHRARLQSVLQGTAGVLAIIGWALGASMVGSEFASRSMTTLLTWETRRTRLITAKAAVVLVTVAAFAAVTLIAVALAMLPTLIAHGAPLGPDDPSIATLAGVIGRGTALASFAAGMGFAIATLGRNTAAALGAGFAYIIVLENILGNSLRRWRGWLLLGNAIVFVSGHADADIPGRSVGGAALVLGGVAAALLVGAAATFRVRDIA